MINCHEPTSLSELLTLIEFRDCREIFIQVGWNPFLTALSCCDDEVSLQFVVGFDGNQAQIGPLVFSVSEEPIAQATGLPRTDKRWFKNYKLS